MAVRNIVFVCFDSEYIATIEYKFAKLIGENASVEYITRPELLQEKVATMKGCDFMIVPSGISIDMSRAKVRSIYYLTDENRADLPSNYIYKYASVRSMLEKMNIGVICDNTSEQSKGTKVVGVFSVSGGNGKTLTSLGLAYQLHKAGKRVLYISTVPHQDFSYYLEYQDFLGMVFCQQCSISVKNMTKLVSDEIRTEDFDFLPAFKNLPVSYHMEFDSYTNLIESIKARNIYDYIIVELSPELQVSKLSFLKTCDRKVFTTTQDLLSVKKLETFMSNMLDFNQQAVIVCNRYRKERPDYISQSSILGAYELSEIVEEYEELTWPMIKQSKLYERTAVCVE